MHFFNKWLEKAHLSWSFIVNLKSKDIRLFPFLQNGTEFFVQGGQRLERRSSHSTEQPSSRPQQAYQCSLRKYSLLTERKKKVKRLRFLKGKISGEAANTSSPSISHGEDSCTKYRPERGKLLLLFLEVFHLYRRLPLLF